MGCFILISRDTEKRHGVKSWPVSHLTLFLYLVCHLYIGRYVTHLETTQAPTAPRPWRRRGPAPCLPLICLFGPWVLPALALYLPPLEVLRAVYLALAKVMSITSTPMPDGQSGAS